MSNRHWLFLCCTVCFFVSGCTDTRTLISAYPVHIDRIAPRDTRAMNLISPTDPHIFEVRAVIEANYYDPDALVASIESFILSADEPEVVVSSIIFLAAELDVRLVTAVGIGIGVAISQIGLTDPSTATNMQAIVAASAGQDLRAAVIEGTSARTASISKGGSPHDVFVQTTIIRNLYGFLNTNRFHADYYEIDFPSDGLVTHVLLKPGRAESNASFLQSFFLIVSELSDKSNDSNFDTENRVRKNLFVFPTKSTPQNFNAHEASTDVSSIAQLLTDNDGYDYDWASDALRWFCLSFPAVKDSPPCADSAAEGPFLIVTLGANQKNSGWILLKDLSGRANVEVYYLDIQDLITAQQAVLRSETASVSISSGYVGKSTTAQILDYYLSLAKGANLVVPNSWDDMWIAPRK